MNVLVACEYSGVVRNAFLEKGHNVLSCDLLPSEDLSLFHLVGDALKVLKSESWDLLIAHPPCQHLAVSGARHFAKKRENGLQAKAIEFFMEFINAPIDKICVENPVCIMSSVYKKPTQIIQPYEFGHPESKKTCLWLKNLPKLKATNILSRPHRGFWNNQTKSGQNKIPPSKNRWKIRSKTYLGIAQAMADQWS